MLGVVRSFGQRPTRRHIDEPTPTWPRGVSGSEVSVKVSAPDAIPTTPMPPADSGELRFLLLNTRTPVASDFTGPDGG